MGRRDHKWHEVDAEACAVVVHGLKHYAIRLRAVSAFAADQQVTEIARSARSQADAIDALIDVIEDQLEPIRHSIER